MKGSLGSAIGMLSCFLLSFLAGCDRSKQADSTRPPAATTQNTPATVPSLATPEPLTPPPLVTTEIDAENVKISSTIDANGTVTPNWDRSQAMGRYKQKCQEHEVDGKILGMASIISDGPTAKPSFIIVGEFFVWFDASAAVPKLLAHNDWSAVVDKDIWKTSDGKSKLVLAHGTAYLLLSGDPNNFEPVGVLTPVIDATDSTSIPGK